MKQILYISNCATEPSGTPGVFLRQELPLLHKHFDRVIVCGHAGIAESASPATEQLPLSRPLFGTLKAALLAPFCEEFRHELAHLFADRKASPFAILKLLMFTMRGLQMHYWQEPYLRTEPDTLLYSFWMSYDAFAAALSKRKHPQMKAVARGHAFDIDRARNPMNPYLMKQMIVSTVDQIYPISQDALARLGESVTLPPNKAQVLMLGSSGQPLAKMPPQVNDGVFRIVSCAKIIPLKQLPLLIDALAQWQGKPLHWLHIGGGPDEAGVMAYAKEHLDVHPTVTYHFAGQQSPAQIQTCYELQAFDVFVNTSSSEGVPVSIMEAMRVGTPIIAPALEGISEIVDAHIGVLYAPSSGADGVLAALQAIASLAADDRQAMRMASQTRWNERCYGESLFETLLNP